MQSVVTTLWQLVESLDVGNLKSPPRVRIELKHSSDYSFESLDLLDQAVEQLVPQRIIGNN